MGLSSFDFRDSVSGIRQYFSPVAARRTHTYTLSPAFNQYAAGSPALRPDLGQ